MSEYIKGLVSVVMPTYKRSEKLMRAIDSVFSQTYTNLELLLVNDNEPGDKYSQDLIQRTKKYRDDYRFNLIFQEKHINGAVARNIGIKKAKGEYIAFLDDDDWWKPEKIEMQVRELSMLSSEWGGISCLIERYNNDVLVAKQPAYKEGYVFKDILLLLSDFETGSLLLRHDALDKAGYFEETLLRHQDLQLLVNFTSKYKLKQAKKYLHCRDVSDAQNRPNVKKAISAKKAFFESVSDVIDTLTPSEKKNIMLMHKAEIGYIKIKTGDKMGGLLEMIYLLKSPKAFGYEMRKLWEKIESKRGI